VQRSNILENSDAAAFGTVTVLNFFDRPPAPTEAFAELPLPGWPSRRAMDMISTAEIDERDPDVAAVSDNVVEAARASHAT
jgi:hypothetical protein